MFLLGTLASMEGQDSPGCRVVTECDQRHQPLKSRLQGQGCLHKHLKDLHLTCIQLLQLYNNCIQGQISRSNDELLLQGDFPL